MTSLSPPECKNFTSEKILVTALQEGNTEAFGCVFVKFSYLIKTKCIKFPTTGDENIFDLYTDTICDLFKKLQKEQENREHNLGGLLNVMFENKIKEYLRNTKKLVSIDGTQENSNHDYTSDNDDSNDDYFLPELQLDEEDPPLGNLVKCLKEVIKDDRLSKKCQDSIEHFVIEEKSWSEVAIILGEKETSLKSNYPRCKKKVEELLKLRYGITKENWKDY